MSQLSRHRHNTGRFDLPLPTDWEVTHEVPDCALVCASRRPRGQLPPHIVVTIDGRDDSEPADEWAERFRGDLVAGLRLRVIDVEQTRVGELAAYRTLSHYVHPGFGGLCLEHWVIPDRGSCCTISCLAESLEYDSLADVFRQVATGLRVGSP
jgi:hypothetical protein